MRRTSVWLVIILATLALIPWISQIEKSIKDLATGHFMGLLAVYVALGFLAVVFVPIFQMRKIKDTSHTLATMRLENELRKTVIQIAGGIGIVFSLFFAWRTLTFNEDVKNSESFVAQTAALTSNDQSTRLNAIYELNNLVQRLPSRQQQFEDMLTHWIRLHPKNPQNGSSKHRTDLDLEVALRLLLGSYSRFTNPDASVRVRILDLSGADLSNLNLSALNFSTVDLSSANLSGADMTYADMRGANLFGANLTQTKIVYANTKDLRLNYTTILNGTDFQGANLEGVVLTQAQLTDVILHEANLKGAYFTGASLDRVWLSKAILTGAHFQGADMRTVIRLKKSQLDVAEIDKDTRLPTTFVPEQP